MKNKQKILWAFEKSKVTAKWKKLQTGAYDDVDQTVFKWFTSKRGQQIPINGSMLEGKAIDFEKARNKSNFKAWIERQVLLKFLHFYFFWITYAWTSTISFLKHQFNLIYQWFLNCGALTFHLYHQHLSPYLW